MYHHLPHGAVHYNDDNCTNNYIPSTAEYMQALGLYGLWLLIMGGISTLLLYSIFLEQVFFSQRGAHRVFRRHIYWIASVYPFMTMMSLASVIVPRAHNICTAVKTTYMAIGITHFTDLTLLMYGSEYVMLSKTSDQRLDLRVGPACCICPCLPSPKVNKLLIALTLIATSGDLERESLVDLTIDLWVIVSGMSALTVRFRLRFTMFMCDQLAFSQAFYYITLLILIAGNNISLGDVNPGSAYLWLTLLNMVSFMSGVWGLQILAKMSNDHLKHYNYNKKSFSMKTLVLVTNFQTLCLQILGYYRVFPCTPPFMSPQVYRQTLENTLYFIEMLVLGCYTYYQYHNHEFLVPNSTEVVPGERCPHCRTETVSTTVSSYPGVGDNGKCPTDAMTIIVEEPNDKSCDSSGSNDSLSSYKNGAKGASKPNGLSSSAEKSNSARASPHMFEIENDDSDASGLSSTYV